VDESKISILLVDPNEEFAGDLAAFLSGRFRVVVAPDVAHVRSADPGCCDIAILAREIAERAIGSDGGRRRWGLKTIILGGGKDEDPIRAGGVIRLERYPSPMRIEAALRSVMVS